MIQSKLKQSFSAVAVTVLCSTLMISLPVQANGDWLDKIKSMIGISEKKAAALSEEQIAQGLKQTLANGTEAVIDKLSKTGAFANDKGLHIELPESMRGIVKALDKVGLGHLSDELETKLNNAAEKSIPNAKPILLKAIKNLTLEDIQGIYTGESDAATQYFKKNMAEPLADALTPVIKSSLTDVGAINTYDNLMAKYNAIPFVPKMDSDIVGWVKDKALTGIFDNLAIEEAAIRKDPAKQTTDLLKQLFSK